MRITTGPRKPRKELDRTEPRFFVYTVLDADERPIYTGRSCDVPGRLRTHERNGAAWVADARSVTLAGPFVWGEAVRVERDEIERHQPPGNRDLTARDHRPGTAARSAARARREPA